MADEQPTPADPTKDPAKAVWTIPKKDSQGSMKVKISGPNVVVLERQ